MKWLGRHKETAIPGQDLLVPPELQQYYHVHHSTQLSGTRKMIAITSMVLVLALIVIGVLTVVLHETNKPAASTHPTHNAPAELPNSGKVNTRSVPQPN